jgi:hypothetical protein
MHRNLVESGKTIDVRRGSICLRVPGMDDLRRRTWESFQKNSTEPVNGALYASHQR